MYLREGVGGGGEEKGEEGEEEEEVDTLWALKALQQNADRR